MRVLVTWGSKRGGTEGIARIIAEELVREGHEVDLLAPKKALDARGFDAAIVGGALYANRWHKDARRFVARRERDLRRVPTWFFSSGPLDETANRALVPPTKQVEILMERIGAQSHVTFGGRLTLDARGFPASAMAKKVAGDYRSPERIRVWAREVASAMKSARPRPVVAQPGRSIAMLALHAAAGWAACAAIMGALLATTSLGVAFTVHALVAPIVFAIVARRYFHYRGAHEPLATAAWMAGLTALLDIVVVAGLIQRDAAMLRSVAGFWLPIALVFFVTWAVGAIASMGPFTKQRA